MSQKPTLVWLGFPIPIRDGNGADRDRIMGDLAPPHLGGRGNLPRPVLEPPRPEFTKKKLVLLN